jgi:hypothetical protein
MEQQQQLQQHGRIADAAQACTAVTSSSTPAVCAFGQQLLQ